MHLRRVRITDLIPESHSSTPRSRRSKRLQQNYITVPIHSKKTNGNGNKVLPKMSQPDSVAGEPRRNVKRKASSAPHSQAMSESLLEEALRPLTAQEIEEWGGWVELESEPAFFNTILKELGIKDVKVQELFTLDQESLEMLPKPVFGLIFLFQYSPSLDESEAEEVDGPLWFANQTTANACATVALLNIVMNHAATIDLGNEIQAFRAATAEMSSPIRGYELGRNNFIRKTHNAFARRMDFLNADLYLEQDSFATRPRKRATVPRAGPSKRKSKKRGEDDYCFHFIAYVPSGGFVWELDGLRSKPRKLDPFEEECWTSVARPQIEARMMQYEESQLSFNLLSVCQSPLKAYRTSVVNAIGALRLFDERMAAQHGAAYTNLVSDSDMKLDPNDVALLAEFDLKPEDTESKILPASLEIKTQEGSLSPHEAASLRSELVIEARASMGEYRGETMAASVDDERVAARKKDFSRALHKWVSKLAEKGVLEDIIKSS